MKINFLRILFVMLFVSSALFFTGCKKNDILVTPPTPAAPKPPTVTVTDAAGAITSTTATSGGTVSSNGGSALTATGVCWSSSTIQPTIADNSTNEGTLTGSFVSNLNGLTPNTLYYAKAYATNSSGTTYGPRISFTTLP